MTTAMPVRSPGDSEEDVENAKAFEGAQPLSCTGCRQEDNTDTDEEKFENAKENAKEKEEKN